MKPRFALDLTNDAIGLLERKAEGWIRVGLADLADPDLAGRLADLRAIAVHRGGDSFVTKLILPNSQILYLELEAPGPDRAAQRAQIRSALHERTPYAVDDLVFDWSRAGQMVKVAVLARETLTEAEGFAESCGFRPVAFVAVPEGDQFGGEPFFGLTARSAEHLPEGERFDRDQDPVWVTGDDLVVLRPAEPALEDLPDEPSLAVPDPVTANDPPAAAVEAKPEPDEPSSLAEPAGETPDGEFAAVVAVEDMDAAVEVGTELAGAMPEPDAVAGRDKSPDAEVWSETASGAEVAADTPAKEAVGDRPDAVEAPVAAEAGDALAEAELLPAEAMAEPAAVHEPAEAEAAFAVPDYLQAEDGTAEDATGPLATADSADEAPAAPADEEAPFVALHDDASAARAAPDDPGPTAHVVTADTPELDGTEAIVSAAAFQSRRPPGPSGQEGARLAEITPRLGGLSGIHAPAKAPRLGGAGTPKAASHTRSGAGRSRPASGAMAFSRAMLAVGRNGLTGRGTRPFEQAMAPPGAMPDRTVFGALRGVAGDRPTSRLILAAALLLLVGAGALWSMWFAGGSAPAPELASADGAAAPPSPGTTAPTAPDVTEAATPATEAQTSPDMPTDATDDTALETEPDTAPDPSEPIAPTEADTAADLPQPDAPTAAPAPPPAAASEPTAAPAIALTETAPPADHGDSLPALGVAAGDTPLPAQPLPQPFGTLVRYDPAGMIVATPEGVITPDGFTLFAAKPPRLPPARPAGLAPAPDLANPATDQNPVPRPKDLTPSPDGAALAPLPGPVDPRHAARKPLSRPAGIVAQAEQKKLNEERVADAAASAARAEAEAAEKALSAASELAVSSSRRPAPRNADAVAAAVAAIAAAVPAPKPVDNSAVEAALAEAQAAPAEKPAPPVEVASAAPTDPIPQELDEPEPQDGVPTMQTTRTVAKKSTFANAIDLGDINLIGVYGSSGNRRALVRLPSGRFLKVKVGDRLDGGQVAAIGEGELSYVKKGRTYVLKMMKNS